MKTGFLRSRIISVLILCALIGVSIWFGSAYASSETYHHRDIEYLGKKQDNAKALSASASAVSVLVSLLPQDTATPLANQISDISRDFMIVLSALAAEQYLLTITGRLTFCWIIPIALGIIILFVLLRRKLFLQIGVKLAIAGCILYMLVPVTLRITRLVDTPYEEAVDNSLQQSREIENAFHYNENGVVMPGMGDGISIPESEAVTESEARAGIQTKLQTEIQTEPETEPREQAQEEKPEKKLPWYERLRRSITGTFSTAADAVSKVPGKVADTASDVAHKVSATATDVAHRVSGTATDVAHKVSDTASDVAQKVSDTATAAVDKVIEAGENASAVAAMVPEVPQMTADLLNSLIDAFVLMIVTTCVLPLAVLIGLLWVAHQVLNINPDWEKMSN